MRARYLALCGHVCVTMALLAAAVSCENKRSTTASQPALDAGTSEVRFSDGPSDREELLECEVAARCLPQITPYTITPDRMACILEGLGERKLERYVHETESSWTNGSAGANQVLITRDDGSAYYARTKYVDLMSLDPALIKEATQLCTLRDPSYFNACAEAALAVQPRDPSAARAWECAFGEGDEHPTEFDVFEGCESASASCE